MDICLPTNSFNQYINGELVKGEGKICEVICPGTEEKVVEFNLASNAQVEAALEAARDAFPLWSTLPLEKRGEWILKLRDAIKEESDKLLTLLLLETGKLRSHAAFETDSLYNYLTFFLEQAKCNYDEIIPDISGGKGMNLVVREPLGVVAAALAWNFPMHNMATKLGPILASGCTAVIKPSTKTPISTLYLGEIMNRIGFPKGVINFVAGDAKDIGKVFSASKIPAMLTMIGSTKGGLQMIADSVTSVKRFSLELGGNAPVIVTPSADIKTAALHCIGNKMRCAGQTCVAPQRVFVHSCVYDEFIKLVVEQGKKAKCGTIDDDANTGPLISKNAVKRMEDIVSDAVTKGASIECGGSSPEEKKKGYYFLPTVLTGVTPHMRAFNEEVFGPILAVMPYKDLDEAIALANETDYGLSSYVWSRDINEINKISRGLQFGIVNVNGPATGPSLPHGGCKNSGIGKDGSHYSLDEYYYIKGIRIALE
jgi:succinate-semialdehyde dehydrogenase/glutarate-semialdehyde dehydrogenase